MKFPIALAALFTLLSTVAAAQDTVDGRLFRDFYNNEAPAVRVGMRVADASFLPASVGGVPLAAAGVWFFRDGGDYSDVYRLAIAEGASVAAVLAVKLVVRRPRPYRALPGVSARLSSRQLSLQEQYDPYAFPSGHAMVAFAMATSWSLSHPQPYVILPAAVWATGVAASRVWLGVHYPGDVLAGALIGSGIGVAVHLLGPHITPAFITGSARSNVTLQPIVAPGRPGLRMVVSY